MALKDPPVFSSHFSYGELSFSAATSANVMPGRLTMAPTEDAVIEATSPLLMNATSECGECFAARDVCRSGARPTASKCLMMPITLTHNIARQARRR